MPAPNLYRTWRSAISAALMALTLGFAGTVASSGTAVAQMVTVEQADEARHAGEFIVPINKSQVLRVDVPFADVLIGNAEIADVVPLTDRSVYVLGKSMGSTSLTLYDNNRGLIAVMDLTVSIDVEGLKARLFELMPGEDIEVRAVNGSVVLSGELSSAGAMDRALRVAERYAPGEVTNLTSIAGSQQVMLQVRFAEVSRNVVRELGINTQVIGSDFQLFTGDVFAGLSGISGFATGLGTLRTGSATIDVLFDALEQKGVVKTLAEPNLIALSGDTANFLAGGEFPVPVAQTSGEPGESVVTVEFKEFGVGLAFTPTVLEDGLINIAVTPEVSRVDPTRSVTVSGFSIPGLATRRATTTVELRDGQAFAIAGLLESNFEDTVRQFPVLGDVPVLGALFRSSEFQRDETELVIIVTPQLVRPADPRNLATPADRFVPPSMPELWLLGRTEGRRTGMSAADAGGISGTYGHIIE